MICCESDYGKAPIGDHCRSMTTHDRCLGISHQMWPVDEKKLGGNDGSAYEARCRVFKVPANEGMFITSTISIQKVWMETIVETALLDKSTK